MRTEVRFCVLFIVVVVVTCALIPAARSHAGEAAPGAAPHVWKPSRLAHTYSIIARDPETGELGVAVQTHLFCVGTAVPWAEAGVGAVASQSSLEPSYGKLGLELMRAGKSPADAIKSLLVTDANAETRQVAMINAAGEAAAHTGSKSVAFAGHVTGKNFSVQADLMLTDKVPAAMAKAFEEAKGHLADRMLAALDAAQAAGGDLRGSQSAALIVVAGKATGRPWADKRFDLRVDDAAEPLKDLRRLVRLQHADLHWIAAEEALEAKDADKALREFRAAEADAPEGIEIPFWHAVALVNLGRVDDSLPIFKKVFAADRNWTEVVRRIRKVGMLPDDDKVIGRILSAG
jgi:uncharacterized Ntn-hydrolase superfamily protein